MILANSPAKLNLMKPTVSLMILIILNGCVGISAYTPDSSDYSFPNAVPVQKTDILHQYGEPDKKEFSPSGETWVYHKGLQWCGITLWVIAPLPLGLPICPSSTAIIFDKNQTTTIHNTYIKESRIKCGPFVNAFGFGMSSGFCL